MIWRPATNPEISFEIIDGRPVGFSINPKFKSLINPNTDVLELYEYMVDINRLDEIEDGNI